MIVNDNFINNLEKIKKQKIKIRNIGNEKDLLEKLDLLIKFEKNFFMEFDNINIEVKDG